MTSKSALTKRRDCLIPWRPLDVESGVHQLHWFSIVYDNVVGPQLCKAASSQWSQPPSSAKQHRHSIVTTTTTFIIMITCAYKRDKKICPTFCDAPPSFSKQHFHIITPTMTMITCAQGFESKICQSHWYPVMHYHLALNSIIITVITTTVIMTFITMITCGQRLASRICYLHWFPCRQSPGRWFSDVLIIGRMKCDHQHHDMWSLASSCVIISIIIHDHQHHCVCRRMPITGGASAQLLTRPIRCTCTNIQRQTRKAHTPIIYVHLLTTKDKQSAHQSTCCSKPLGQTDNKFDLSYFWPNVCVHVHTILTNRPHLFDYCEYYVGIIPFL